MSSFPPFCEVQDWPDSDPALWVPDKIRKLCTGRMCHDLEVPETLDSPGGFGVFCAGLNLRVVFESAKIPSDAECEVHFCPVNDGLTRWQFVVDGRGNSQTHHYQPDFQVHRSDFRAGIPFQSGRIECGGCELLWMEFPREAIFPDAGVVGFQAAWSHGSTYRSWAFCSGNGGPDASSYGTLGLAGCKPVEFPSVAISKSTPACLPRLAVTNDPPMSLMVRPYSPARLDNEAESMRAAGISRLHWIDYEPLLNRWPDPRWAANIEPSLAACDGNLLRAACEACRAHGLEIFADLKIYDTGCNIFWVPEGTPGARCELDGVPFAVGEGLIPDACMSLPHGVPSEARAPVRRLTLCSTESPGIFAGDGVEVLVSSDNRAYRSTGLVRVTDFKKMLQPARRWTPFGIHQTESTHCEWRLILENLDIREPYCHLCWRGERPPRLVHSGAFLVEATDAAGSECPVTLATSGARDFSRDGCFFWKERCRWFPVADPLFEARCWDLGGLAMAFRHWPRMEAVPEPCSELAHEIWLGWIRRILDAGVDGVSIRTLCHHQGVESYLKYACGPAALARFEAVHGRPFVPATEDFARLRRVRGEAFADFLTKASALIRGRGRKLAVQLENGCQIPGEYEAPMQMEFPWRRILSGHLADEVALRWFTIYHPWVAREVLPRARAAGVSVHAITRNLHGCGIRRLPRWMPRWMADAGRMGIAACNLYEWRDLLDSDHGGFSEDARSALISINP